MPATTYELREITKIDEERERVVVVATIWIEAVERTIEQQEDIARKWRSSCFGRVLETETIEGKRSPRFHRNIVSNLRFSQANLAPFTDDQIYSAYERWAVSTDFGDENLVVDWIVQN